MDEADNKIYALFDSDPNPTKGRMTPDEGGVQAAAYRTLPPAWVNLKQITTEQVALYHQVPS